MPFDTYRPMVVVDALHGHRVVGLGTLLIERKFIHECNSAGHIEDVVVSEQCRGQNLGRLIVDALIAEARLAGCYKVILDCGEKNVAFYERCGFTRKEVQMALYFK